MARPAAVGLDIGTSGVRAAEVSLGKNAMTLERFGQVALPASAVVDGEVLDEDAVASALRQLWAATRFSTKKVVLGVANQRVIVRQVDLPWMQPADLKASLPYQVQDFIPMPVDQVLLDYHALEEVTGDNGQRMLRVLLVAAAKEMVWRSINAVRKAGLTPVGVDLVPFALMRALTTYDHLGFSSEEAEAFVNVGASVTNIVIHTGGVPRFVRILPMGSGSITDALAERLGVSLDEAEIVKQSASMAGATGKKLSPAPEDSVIESVGSALVDEIRNSLEYYKAQPTAVRVGRLVLSGGGGRLGGFGGRLAGATRLPVEDGSVLSTVQVGKVGLTPEQLAYIDPLASVPVGLALGAA